MYKKYLKQVEGNVYVKKELEEIFLEEMEERETKKKSEKKEFHTTLLGVKLPEEKMVMYFNPGYQIYP